VELQAAAWEVPDLIVTDVRLPGYSGIQILELLRQRGCAIPAIVMSGFSAAELRTRAEELGIVALFEKPFGLGAFVPRSGRASRREP
jgi:CheY-like chemotaxis protein